MMITNGGTVFRFTFKIPHVPDCHIDIAEGASFGLGGADIEINVAGGQRSVPSLSPMSRTVRLR
jgi:hypothetical protein